MEDQVQAIISGHSVDDVISSLLERSKLGKYSGLGAAAGGALGAALAARKAKKGKKLKAALIGGSAGAIGGAAVGAAAHGVRTARRGKAAKELRSLRKSAEGTWMHTPGKGRTPDSLTHKIPKGTVLNPKALKREKRLIMKRHKKGKRPSSEELAAARKRFGKARERREATKAERTAEAIRKKREAKK